MCNFSVRITFFGTFLTLPSCQTIHFHVYLENPFNKFYAIRSYHFGSISFFFPIICTYPFRTFICIHDRWIVLYMCIHKNIPNQTEMIHLKIECIYLFATFSYSPEIFSLYVQRTYLPFCKYFPSTQKKKNKVLKTVFFRRRRVYKKKHLL